MDQNSPYCTTYATNNVEPSSWEPVSNQIAELREGTGSYPVLDDPKHPVNVWYESLGFDPETMNEDDMRRLTAKAHEEWAASIPRTKLSKREINALRFFSAIGPNIKVHWRDVKDCGPDTEERLNIRGFLETFPQEKFPDRIGYYMLTAASLAAWHNCS